VLLRIQDEYSSLWRPLPADEFEALKESIRVNELCECALEASNEG